MLPTVLLPTLLWLGQSPGITFLAPVPPGPRPDYARPVVQSDRAVVPETVAGCIHRPAELPFNPEQLDRAAMRILQLIKWSRLREAKHFASLGSPAAPDRRLIPRRPPSPEERLRLRAIAAAIDEHWKYFEARLYEVRMFRHRPEEGQLACRRAAEAWDALLGLIRQHPDPLPPDLVKEFEAVDALVAVIRASSI
ncbi:hypothetical protein [Tautonia plasticadhaerens]|uniref:Uncharacterized protein n=1 Tax=Tautonia plasticadhaerens TaxID=2527974 RepID=A0A518HCW2_9BACT|nr:hypothetical protein [Tautonia plasticadhaerens]QDV38697.1 hypothetical protein ElP_66520 [Tautonia plasticadhaerens]